MSPPCGRPAPRAWTARPAARRGRGRATRARDAGEVVRAVPERPADPPRRAGSSPRPPTATRGAVGAARARDASAGTHQEPHDAAAGPAARLTSLQRAAGNAAVSRLLVQRQPLAPPAAGSVVAASGVDPLSQSITADQARTLTDGEIARFTSQLDAVVHLPASTMTADGARHNLRVLWGERNRRRPDASRVPDGGTTVGKPGLVGWQGQPELRLRTHPDTGDETNVIQGLPFNSRVQILKAFPGDWYFVSTTNGDTGYAGSQYIRTDAPEPAARLHKVEAGTSAIGIAEQYYGEKSDDWGQDLRFYVNVLAWANKVTVPDETSGWKNVHFRAGQTIWVPSQPFARSLKGVVNSGSRSYNIADALGVADVIERIGEILEDFGTAIDKSGQYIPEAVARHVEEMLREALAGLAVMMAVAAGLLAVTTAIGAALGALAGGAGAAPGAAAGFEAGVALLEWLGLGMLVVWIGASVVQVGASFADFFGKVWAARGDAEKIDKAARQFAEAIGLLLAKLCEALIMYVTAKGLPVVLRSLRGTRLGTALGETRAAQWLQARATNVAAGGGPVPTPQTVFSGPRAGAQVQVVPADVTVVGNGGMFGAVPQSRLPGNLPQGHYWAQDAAGGWTIVREPGAAPVALELAVYSDGVNVNYVLRGDGRMIASDALSVPPTYTGPRLPQEISGTGANNPYRDPATGQLYDKSHGVDYAHTLEGPGVRNSSTDVANFTPGAAWWNRGARNHLVQQISANGGGYREMPVYDANPRVTVDGTPVPREFIFVETNRQGVPQRAWRVPNDPTLTDQSLAAVNPHSIPLAQVPQAMMRPNAPVAPDVPNVTYLPGVMVGKKGDDEK